MLKAALDSREESVDELKYAHHGLNYSGKNTAYKGWGEDFTIRTKCALLFLVLYHRQTRICENKKHAGKTQV